MKSNPSHWQALASRKISVLRSLRHYLRAQSRGHHIIDRLEERGVERGSARRSSSPWKDERGRTLEPFQRQRWGNFWETGWSAYGLFRAHRYHLELNWIELNWSYETMFANWEPLLFLFPKGSLGKSDYFSPVWNLTAFIWFPFPISQLFGLFTDVKILQINKKKERRISPIWRKS